MNNIDFKKDFKIKNISYLHSFEYFEDYLIAYKYYNVGTGNKIMYKDLTKLDSKDIKNKIENFSLKIHDSNEMNDFGNLKSKSNNLSLIKCKFDGCNYSTSDKNEIKEHNGSHELHLNQHSKIKLKYAEKVSDMRTNNLLIESAYKNDNENSIMNSINDLKKGIDKTFEISGSNLSLPAPIKSAALRCVSGFKNDPTMRSSLITN